jgi:hypothetical protein
MDFHNISRNYEDSKNSMRTCSLHLECSRRKLDYTKDGNVKILEKFDTCVAIYIVSQNTSCNFHRYRSKNLKSASMNYVVLFCVFTIHIVRRFLFAPVFDQ